MAAGATAMATLIGKALGLAGELEQNVGGAGAVFAEFADKVQEKAVAAYEKMGLSTAGYLATANKMGALFKGAGFEIEEAMDLTTESMQRAADVASIMGIDVSAAMESVAGAAKGNFTMMDNLGVAINDTTLKAYALEKGITKSTQAMTTQEKVGLAMEMFLEKTAYAAGNYAKENETLAGSFNTAKAAMTNFLDGSGDVEQLVNSFTNAANVIVRNITTIAPRLAHGISDVVSNLIPYIPPLLEDLLPAVIEGAVSLVNGLVDAFPAIRTAFMDILPSFSVAMLDIAGALIAALPDTLELFVLALPSLVPQIVSGLIDLAVMIAENLPDIALPVISALPMIATILIVTLVGHLIDFLSENIPKFVNRFLDYIENMKDSAIEKFTIFKDNVTAKITELATNALNKFDEVRDGIQDKIDTAREFVGNAIEKIKGFFDFEWKLPHIKLPHFSISGSFSLNPPSIPHFGVDWYAKAMNNPMLLTEPTIFGFDPVTGKARGGGEAGTEVVSGANTLMNMIQNAVGINNEALIAVLYKILEAIITMDENMGGNLREALDGMAFKVDKREIARLVKGVT